MIHVQVPQGSVTPFAVANPEAAHVALLLDHKILAEARVFVHPLVNTASLGMSPSALTAGLKCVAALRHRTVSCPAPMSCPHVLPCPHLLPCPVAPPPCAALPS